LFYSISRRENKRLTRTRGQVLDRGSLENAQYRSKARRLMQKLSETLEQLPGSLFIASVNDYDTVPTFRGGFGDVYRASHQGCMVAVKHIRSFTSNAHRARLVGG
jgi:hypothetical protein